MSQLLQVLDRMGRGMKKGIQNVFRHTNICVCVHACVGKVGFGTICYGSYQTDIDVALYVVQMPKGHQQRGSPDWRVATRLYYQNEKAFSLFGSRDVYVLSTLGL